MLDAFIPCMNIYHLKCTNWCFFLVFFSEGISKVNTVKNFVFKTVKINFVSAAANLRVFGGRVSLLFTSLAC